MRIRLAAWAFALLLLPGCFGPRDTGVDGGSSGTSTFPPLVDAGDCSALSFEVRLDQAASSPETGYTLHAWLNNTGPGDVSVAAMVAGSTVFFDLYDAQGNRLQRGGAPSPTPSGEPAVLQLAPGAGQAVRFTFEGRWQVQPGSGYSAQMTYNADEQTIPSSRAYCEAFLRNSEAFIAEASP